MSYFDYGYYPGNDAWSVFDYMNGADYMTTFYFVWAIVQTVIIVCVVLSVVMYVFQALGIYSIAKRRGIEYAWMAWIPVVNYYMFGKVADEYNARVDGKKTSYAWGLLIGSIVTLVLALVMIPMAFTAIFAPVFWVGVAVVYFVLLAVSITMAVFQYIALYKIYKSTTESCVVLLVLSILFSFIMPFVLFAVRNGEFPKRNEGDGTPGLPPLQPMSAPNANAGGAYQTPNFAPSQQTAPTEPQATQETAVEPVMEPQATQETAAEPMVEPQVAQEPASEQAEEEQK